MIFKEGALLLASGITAGFIIALALARLVASQMYGVNERDPFSFAGRWPDVSRYFIPCLCNAARRATNIDPIASLRCE